MVDRNSAVPLYYQVANYLREQIQKGILKPGDRIPSEWELVKEFNISRQTARQAISELVAEGWIFRRAGKGSFVATPKINSQLSTMIGFLQKMAQQGFRVGTRLISAGVVPAPEGVASNLKVAPGEKVIEIQRLRIVDEQPAVLQWAYLPFPKCVAVLEADLNKESLITTLQQKCGLKLAHSRDSVQAGIARGSEAALLGIKEGTPLLIVEGVLYSEDNEPIRYGKGLYRGDMFKLTVENYEILGRQPD